MDLAPLPRERGWGEADTMRGWGEADTMRGCGEVDTIRGWRHSLRGVRVRLTLRKVGVKQTE